MTLTDPPAVQSQVPPVETAWMSFDDVSSLTDTLSQVRHQAGRVAVWLTDVPTRFTPDQETVLWEVALRARTLVVPSRCALARVLASGVVHPASVVVVPMPTRLAASGVTPAPVSGAGPVLVTPTSLHQAERIDSVLEAIAGLRRRGVAVRYHVVGDPGAHRHRNGHDGWGAGEALDRWDRWQQRATRLGLNDRVVWSLEGDPLGAMASAQVVVLPWETDDLVASQGLIDAVSLGVPVVASSFPHAVELAPTGAVAVWRTGSRDGLERALHRVLTRPLLRTAMRHAARQVARAHRPEAVDERLHVLTLAPTILQR